MPHLQHGAKMLGKKALQTGVDVAQDVLAGENLAGENSNKKSELNKIWAYPPRILLSQVLVKKVQKGKSTTKEKQFISRQETENISKARETRRQIFLLEVKWLLFITNLKSAGSQNSISLQFQQHKHLSPKGNGLSTTPLSNITDTGPIEFNVAETGRGNEPGRLIRDKATRSWL